MTFGEVKNASLSLLNAYSIAGTEVASSYNNQADVLNAIPFLINDAMLEIATTAKPIPAKYVLTASNGTPHGDGWLSFEMPDDFFQLNGGGIPRFENQEFTRVHSYRWSGRATLLIKEDELSDDMYVEYYRYPTLITAATNPNTELDNVSETHMAIPFYVAAHIVIHEDAFLYASFYNKYEDKLSKMGETLQTDVNQVEDVYDGAFSGDWE